MARETLTGMAYKIEDLSLEELHDIRRLIELRQQFLSYQKKIFIPDEKEVTEK